MNAGFPATVRTTAPIWKTQRCFIAHSLFSNMPGGRGTREKRKHLIRKIQTRKSSVSSAQPVHAEPFHRWFASCKLPPRSERNDRRPPQASYLWIATND